jgi:3D (Asp-Asp-Asp) domain-containing protein
MNLLPSRMVLAHVAGFVLGLLAAHRMQAPLLDAYSAELQHAHQVAARRGALLERARRDVDAAAARVEAAERACRTPLRRGERAPFAVTAYGIGCDAPGPRTKAGTLPVEGFTIAADPAVLPVGSRVHVDGLGERQVHDVGSAVRGRQIDVYLEDCSRASAWGRQVREVEVLHVASAR